MSKVALAVLHGHAIGGGLQLAVACDLRLATSDAVVGLGASRHGIIPDGSVLRLARLIGLARAKELSLLNDEISAEAARAMGLVTRVCASGDVDAALTELLERLRHQAPTANGHIKRLMQASFHEDPRALIEDVVRAQDDCMRSWETREANRAWEEKREPVRRSLLLVICSNRGLCGGYNTAILREANTRLREIRTEAVDLQLEPARPPDVLYHGTAGHKVPDVLRGGVKRMSRHHVHLSTTPATALTVGARHGKPVVLRVDGAFE